MPEPEYVEMEFTVRTRTRIPEGLTIEEVEDSADEWANGIVNELQTGLLGGDVKRFFEKVSVYTEEVITDPEEFNLGNPYVTQD